MSYGTLFSAALLGSALAAATPAAAAPRLAEAATDTIKGCYVNGSGTIYRTNAPNAPAACTSGNHVPMRWPDGQGDDYQRYLLTEGVRMSLNGFAVTGQEGMGGSIPTSGPGTRLMWYPKKGAFRAGLVSGTYWDDSNIGTHSIAMGRNARASGISSVALGNNAQATGNYSTALGLNTTASGLNAFVMGSSSNASGNYAVAAGQNNTASGPNSLALGRQTTASGNTSTAMGSGTAATGHHATAIGSSTSATSSYAIAAGQNAVASGVNSMALGRNADTNARQGAFVYGDASSDNTVRAQQNNQFVVRAQRFWFGNNNNVTATAGRFIETSVGAYLSQGGAWVSVSDVNRKHHFETVDGEQVLRKVAAMPISTWSYKDDESTVRHMGPMAQDFYAAFGLGDSETAIASVDADGVSLAAIQALEKRTRDQDARIERLEREKAELIAGLAELRQRVAALEAAR